MAHQLVRDGCSMAERLCNFQRSPCTSACILDNASSIRLCNLNFFFTKVLLDKGASDITLARDRRWSWDAPFLRYQGKHRISFVRRRLFPVRWWHRIWQRLMLFWMLRSSCTRISHLDQEFQWQTDTILNDGSSKQWYLVNAILPRPRLRDKDTLWTGTC